MEATNKAWILAIEALLHMKQLDLSTIIEVIRSVPGLSDDLSRNARDLLGIRVLEDVYTRSKNSSSVPPVSLHGSKTKIDVSRLCEEAVERILQGASLSDVGLSEARSLEVDIPFLISKKRSRVQKCSLHQLKNGILEGRDPILKPLKDRSGLQVPDKNSRSPIGEDVSKGIADQQDVSENTEAKNKLASFTGEDDESSEDNLPISKLQSTKKVRNVVVARNCEVASPEPCGTLEESPKKLKRVLSCFPKKPHEVSASACRHEKLGESSSRNVEHIEEPDRGNEDTCADASERVKENNDIDPGVVFRVNISGVVFPYQKLVPYSDSPSEDISSGGIGFASEPPAITVNVGGENLQENGSGEANNSISDIFQHNVDIAMSKVDDMHGDILEISSDDDEYHNVRTDIAMRKNNFLSSQGIDTQDSLGTQLNSCVKCNKGGNVLSCSSRSCPLVVHEECLGSAIGFDRMGNFYCPFCAYSQAISRYQEAKKKFSLARTNLATFHVFSPDLEEKSL